ncbi:hypothetical protein [Candidatus Weimeria sp. HCP3S3_B5]|uniref:hypothetical protein n=1 Tax=Candidatus Weimeria sp. HCP3S3_B5 TaxID=3438871 RepID=UPI003F888C30
MKKVINNSTGKNNGEKINGSRKIDDHKARFTLEPAGMKEIDPDRMSGKSRENQQPITNPNNSTENH